MIDFFKVRFVKQFSGFGTVFTIKTFVKFKI